VSSAYEVIDRDERCPVVKKCVWLGVSRSGFYDWRDRPLSATTLRREAVTVLVTEVFEEFEQRYGYRKIAVEVARRGHRVSEQMVRDIMASEGLVCCHPRPWRATTDNDGSGTVVDRLGGDFTATAPGERFVGDITYVKTWGGWLYLATVIDLFNREVVGYSMASHMRTELICDAVDRAVANGRVRSGAVFHSDRGSQYTSHEFAAHLKANGMVGSMGRTGVCWDNAVAESFFATLKKELVYRTVFPTQQHAVRVITEYVEVFYNRRRIHSKLGYNTPLETRKAWENRQEAA
jgi:putative transposase